MNYFTFDQIIEIRIREYDKKNGGFEVATLPVLPKENQAVSVTVTGVKDQLSPTESTEIHK